MSAGYQGQQPVRREYGRRDFLRRAAVGAASIATTPLSALADRLDVAPVSSTLAQADVSPTAYFNRALWDVAAWFSGDKSREESARTPDTEDNRSFQSRFKNMDSRELGAQVAKYRKGAKAFVESATTDQDWRRAFAC